MPTISSEQERSKFHARRRLFEQAGRARVSRVNFTNRKCEIYELISGSPLLDLQRDLTAEMLLAEGNWFKKKKKHDSESSPTYVFVYTWRATSGRRRRIANQSANQAAADVIHHATSSSSKLKHTFADDPHSWPHVPRTQLVTGQLNEVSATY